MNSNPTLDPTKRQCSECEWRGPANDLLRAPSPFLDGEELVACPSCGRVDGTMIFSLCEIQGCNKVATCGTPLAGTYGRLCSAHFAHLSEQTEA